MTGKYEHWNIDNNLEKAIISGDKNLLIGKCAFAISIKDKDPTTSNKYLIALAEGGLPEAHMQLSKRYEKGDTLPTNYGKALSHLLSAAELGYIQAMSQLGGEYRYGREYRKNGIALANIDLAEAKKWYLKAAGLGDSWSSENLADMLLDGRVAKQCSSNELQEIEMHYLKAGKFFKLGSMYCTDKDSGDCSEVEIKTAKKWYLRGKETGNRNYECEECDEILKRWGEPDLVVKSSSENSISLMEILLTPVSLVIWFIVGTFLLGIFTSISAVTFPLIIIFAIIAAIYKVIKSK